LILLFKEIISKLIAKNAHLLMAMIRAFQKPIYIPQMTFVSLRAENHVVSGRRKCGPNSGVNIFLNIVGPVKHRVKFKRFIFR